MDKPIYVGAAPGNHIQYLSELFPEITMVLYDPRDLVINPTDKILFANSYLQTQMRLNGHRTISISCFTRT